MLIDWMTLQIPTSVLGNADRLRDRMLDQPHVMRYTPSTGEIEYNKPTRTSIRSDSHRITVAVGERVSIEGSPARSAGQPNNVFGTLDVRAAAFAHIEAAEIALGLPLPRDLTLYVLTKLDVTCNYEFAGLSEVRQALSYLRQTDAGRYKLSSKASTVYWSPSSSLRAGKAYAKGQHARFQMKSGDASYTDEQLEAVDRLLRLELRLGNEFWRRLRSRGEKWSDLTPEYLLNAHDSYFSALIGTPEVAQMSDVADRIDRVAPTPGQAKAANLCWMAIQSVGHETVRSHMSRSTWYRNLRILQSAGLGWGDICAGHVVQIRKAPLVIAQPCTGWAELLQKAA